VRDAVLDELRDRGLDVDAAWVVPSADGKRVRRTEPGRGRKIINETAQIWIDYLRGRGAL
jgi:hypothetical protein